MQNISTIIKFLFFIANNYNINKNLLKKLKF